jgi:hypothetical protein
MGYNGTIKKMETTDLSIGILTQKIKLVDLATGDRQ